MFAIGKIIAPRDVGCVVVCSAIVGVSGIFTVEAGELDLDPLSTVLMPNLREPLGFLLCVSGLVVDGFAALDVKSSLCILSRDVAQNGRS